MASPGQVEHLSLTRFIDYIPNQRAWLIFVLSLSIKIHKGGEEIYKCDNEELGFEAMHLSTGEIWL